MATVGTSLNDKVAAINSRADLVEFIRDLLRDYHDDHDRWDNSALDQYLEAMAAWSQDMEGYFRNRGEPAPQTPSWNLIAMMLLAARRYE